MTQETLSDKSESFIQSDLDRIGDSVIGYFQEDVKEFIKRLKDRLEGVGFANAEEHVIANEIIDQLAGERLI